MDRVGGRGSVPIDIRVIAATNKGLEAAIKERTFREDLYYRLKVIHIHTPSLRDVPQDIAVLANHFLSKYCEMMNTERKQFTTGALEEMSSYSWPGNARQLENEIKRLVASVRGKSITEDHLDGSVRNRSGHSKLPAQRGTGAEVADVSILTGRRRAVRTPADRRGTAKFWWQQTKSGSGARPEPPRAD